MALRTINGKPITAAPAPAARMHNSVADAAAANAPVKKATHKPECGDVGETGEHGDLGSNAA